MQNPANASPIITTLAKKEKERAIHAHGAFAYDVLGRLETLLPENMAHTAETGCGRSTILFSNISDNHSAFCIDDHDYGDSSSVGYVEDSTMAQLDKVHWRFGPTQATLPGYKHECEYDCVLLDGPHGYPFPDMEYYFFYPHIRPGGYLIVDDVHIPTIGRMADVIQEDAMWELVELISTTALFRRTDAPLTSPTGDLWWTQNFNRRRIPRTMEFYLGDGQKMTSFAARTTGSGRSSGIVRNVVRSIRRIITNKP